MNAKYLDNVEKTWDGIEGTTRFPLFESNVQVLVYGDIPEEYVRKCIESMWNLEDSVIENLCRGSISYCNHFLDSVEAERKEFSNTREVLRDIRPNSFVIDEVPEGEKPVVHLELECVWEPEHGMEWFILDGKEILYIGPYIGVGANAVPEKDFESWNFA